MANEYVPTEPEVNGIRDSWACAHVREDITLEQAREAFDRWIAAVRAEALREGAVHLRETARRLDSASSPDRAYINCTYLDADELDLLADEWEKSAGS